MLETLGFVASGRSSVDVKKRIATLILSGHFNMVTFYVASYLHQCSCF